MKLISLRLSNFRQFYGKTPSIKFANGTRNITVVHGNNGAGKTTLLNALTWVLYEKFSAAFSASEFLVNLRAITEAKVGEAVECWVDLQFEHDGKLYQAKRRCYAHKNEEGQVKHSPSQLFMLVAGDDGSWYHPLQTYEDIINTILPASLHQYFFFDGEHIEHLLRQDSHEQIAEDTKELLGVKVLDRAIDHLDRARKSLQQQLKNYGDSEIDRLLTQQTDLEQQRDRLNRRQQEINQLIKDLQQQKQTLQRQILDHSGAEELQQLVSELTRQEQSTRDRLIEAKNHIKTALSRQSYQVWLTAIAKQFQSWIATQRSQNQLSTPIKPMLIQQLLQRQRCICGNQLLPQTKSYQMVEVWLEQAEIADVEQAAILTENQVDQLAQQQQDFWQTVDAQQLEINTARLQLASIENQLDELKHKLRKYPDRDIRQLQQQLDSLETEIQDLTLETGANQQQKISLQQQIEVLLQQLTKQQHQQAQINLTQRRIRATVDAAKRIAQVRQLVESQFRAALEQRVREIFSAISFTPYQPSISDRYELKLIDYTTDTPIEVAASTGENQILSLSFIGGIIDRVREWSQKNTLVGLDSSTFPVVMDSPFGSLDEIYRRQIARSIPQLANQLVVLTTKTQWRGEVETEMTSHIGQQYVLVYYSPKTNCTADFLSLKGKDYALVLPSPNQFEYTEIVSVN